ncbi:retrovirus-related pol polyprotein from transposon TNT 1-94 [Tanacetum coccineum]
MTESPLMDSSFVVPVFSQRDDPIACLNKAMAFLTAVASSRFPSTNNQLRTSSNPRNQATIQDGRVTVQQVHGRQGQSYSDAGFKSNATSFGEIMQADRQGLLNATTVKVKDIWLGNALGLSDQGMHHDPGVPDDISNAKRFSWPTFPTMVLTLSQRFWETFYSTTRNDDEQAFWVRISNPTSKPSDASPVKIEAPKEAPKEVPKVSLVNESLKKLKYHLARFDNVVKIRTTPDASAKELFLENDRLLQQIMSQDVLLTVMHSMSLLGEFVNMDGKRKESCNLEAELFKSQNAFNNLLKRYSQLEKHFISLKASIQLNQEIFQKDESCNNQNTLEIPEFFEKNDLKAQLQDKDTTICKLKDMIKSMREKSKEENVKYDYDEIETKNVELENRLKCSTSKCGSKPTGNKRNDRISQTTSINIKNKVEAQPRKVNKKNHVVKSICDVDVKHSLLNTNSEPICANCKKSMFDGVHDKCLLDFVENVNSRAKSAKKHKKQNIWKPTSHVFTEVGFKWKPTGRTFTIVVVQIVLWYMDSGCLKHMTGNRSQLMNFVSKFQGTVRFGNDNIARIIGYGDYQLGNVTISRVYYVEGLGHNLFFVGQFCDADLEVSFRKNTCFIRNLEGVDLLSGSRDINLYTISLDDMLKTSPIFHLSKASKTKSWLWNHRLSHLNFGTLNKLAKDGLAQGIPMLKFQKDHLCPACALGKSKKSSHRPKAEDTNQEKLYLLHMDLYGPMRVASINEKSYILVIVDDYSRFT